MAGVREPHESGLSPTSTTARPGVTLWLGQSGVAADEELAHDDGEGQRHDSAAGDTITTPC